MDLPPVLGAPDPGGADCVTCGRCCHLGVVRVHYLVSDETRMGRGRLRRFTVVDERSGYRFGRMAGARCACLDVTVPGRFPCRVYAARPDDCRLVMPGDPFCLDSRRLGHAPPGRAAV